MAKIVIENLGQKTLLVRELTLPVLRHLHNGYVDWMHACGAKGRCTTCKMIVVSGMESLTPLTPAELKYRQQGMLGDHERLACQAHTAGDITIRVADEYKLPHLTYTS